MLILCSELSITRLVEEAQKSALPVYLGTPTFHKNLPDAVSAGATNEHSEFFSYWSQAYSRCSETHRKSPPIPNGSCRTSAFNAALLSSGLIDDGEGCTGVDKRWHRAP